MLPGPRGWHLPAGGTGHRAAQPGNPRAPPASCIAHGASPTAAGTPGSGQGARSPPREPPEPSRPRGRLAPGSGHSPARPPPPRPPRDPGPALPAAPGPPASPVPTVLPHRRAGAPRGRSVTGPHRRHGPAPPPRGPAAISRSGLPSSAAPLPLPGLSRPPGAAASPGPRSPPPPRPSAPPTRRPPALTAAPRAPGRAAPGRREGGRGSRPPGSAARPAQAAPVPDLLSAWLATRRRTTNLLSSQWHPPPAPHRTRPPANGSAAPRPARPMGGSRAGNARPPERRQIPGRPRGIDQSGARQRAPVPPPARGRG
ncbi:basic proline-rich protein-like [Cinclus cinclus]|uniref:basic proline-rich protein-like n=1 Tax=Cinclus cinclus TaxID=127875 RepID=UPI002E12B1AA